jgi:sec-independent protein translocase protein TatA
MLNLPVSNLILFNLGPSELLLLLLVVVLLIWGPTQLPKLARSIGQAKKEFQKAQEEESEEEEEDELIKLAKELGIDTKGKTRDEIRKEILEKTKKSD